MKKTSILAVILTLYGQGMAAENTREDGALSRPESLSSETIKIKNYEEKIQSLTQKLEQEKVISKYYKDTLRDIGVLTLPLNILGVGACALKIVSFIQEYNLCSDITKQSCSVICPRNSFDFQALIRTPKSNLDICLFNAGADFFAYVTVVIFIGLAVYCQYKWLNRPKVTKYKTD